MNVSLARAISGVRTCFIFLVACGYSAAAHANVGPGQTQYNPVLNPPFNFFTPSYTAGPLPAQFNILVATHNFADNYDGTLNGAFFGFVTSSVYANSAGQLAFTYVFNNLAPPPLGPE